MSVDRPDNPVSAILPPAECKVYPVGTLLFFTDESMEGLFAGTVIEQTDAYVTVQINQPKEGVDTWLPRWEDPDRPHLILRHRVSSVPSGYVPFTDTVHVSQVVATGSFVGANCTLTDATVYYLRSLGYDV